MYWAKIQYIYYLQSNTRKKPTKFLLNSFLGSIYMYISVQVNLIYKI